MHTRWCKSQRWGCRHGPGRRGPRERRARVRREQRARAARTRTRLAARRGAAGPSPGAAPPPPVHFSFVSSPPPAPAAMLDALRQSLAWGAVAGERRAPPPPGTAQHAAHKRAAALQVRAGARSRLGRSAGFRAQPWSRDPPPPPAQGTLEAYECKLEMMSCAMAELEAEVGRGGRGRLRAAGLVERRSGARPWRLRPVAGGGGRQPRPPAARAAGARAHARGNRTPRRHAQLRCAGGLRQLAAPRVLRALQWSCNPRPPPARPPPPPPAAPGRVQGRPDRLPARARVGRRRARRPAHAPRRRA